MSLEEYREFMMNLNNLRKGKINCDVVIKIGNAIFPAHRVLLISRMEFFQKMFNAEMKEKNELVVKLDPEIISPEVFENILNYIYTFELKLTDENAPLICVAANFFCDEKLKKKIENFFQINFKVDNVSKCLEMATRIGLKTLQEKCFNFVVKNSLLRLDERRMRRLK